MRILRFTFELEELMLIQCLRLDIGELAVFELAYSKREAIKCEDCLKIKKTNNCSKSIDPKCGL